MPNSKTITITMNPALDKTINVDKINYGEVNRIDGSRLDLGGKGVNVGRILSGFGVDNEQITIIGEENKKSVLDFFEKDSMDVAYVEVPGYTRTNMVIVEREKDITTDINEAGVSVTSEDVEKVMALIEEYSKDRDYIIMGGSLPKGMPKNIYGRIAKEFKDECKVIIDADGDYLIEGIKGSPYMIKPNIHELENALDIELHSIVEIKGAARQFINDYGISLVLVSMGKDGALLVTKDEAYQCEAIPTEVVSTVGAGDSMVAGFVYGLSQGLSLKESLAFGAACSTLTIQVPGYPRLKLEAARDLMKKAVIIDY